MVTSKEMKNTAEYLRKFARTMKVKNFKSGDIPIETSVQLYQDCKRAADVIEIIIDASTELKKGN